MDEMEVLRTDVYYPKDPNGYICANSTMAEIELSNNWQQKKMFLYNRWPWHLFFWIGYILFRSWPYYITLKYYRNIYLEYMLLSEIFFVAVTYFTIWLYRRSFLQKKYLLYFIVGTGSWLLYLAARTLFQLYYLKNDPGFRGANFNDIFINNITFAIIGFLFITACKYFKDGYISQQFEAEKKKQQLQAEVNNLKSQIAPHFLFNTLNNLYGLAVEKSDKLPDLMLRLSDLLRHSLYETRKPLIPITEEIMVLNSYIELETLRLEDDLKLEFDNQVPANAQHNIAPLILIVFVENAFKHAKLVESAAVNIYIETRLKKDLFTFIIKNNYNHRKTTLGHGIGLANVKRRLELLYPNGEHELTIQKDELFYTVILKLKLAYSD